MPANVTVETNARDQNAAIYFHCSETYVGGIKAVWPAVTFF